jgi:hypothetical protein
MLVSQAEEGYGIWTDEIWISYYSHIPYAQDDVVTVYGTVYSTVGAGRGATRAASTAAIHRAAGTAPLGDNATVGQHLHVIAGAFATDRELAREHWALRSTERRSLALGSTSAEADSRTGSRRPAMSDQRALNAANRHTPDHRQPRRRRPKAFRSYAGRVRRAQGPRRRATARHGRGKNGDRDESGHEPGNRTEPAAHSTSKARPTAATQPKVPQSLPPAAP